MFAVKRLLSMNTPRCFWLIIGLFLLNACGGTASCSVDACLPDLSDMPVGEIEPLEPPEPYDPFSYSAANLRSPFERPFDVIARDEIVDKYPGLKPNIHETQFLERFSITSLKMVGLFQQKAESWALIEDPDGGVHRVQPGDYLGMDNGMIKNIDNLSVEILEIVSNGATGWLPRPRTLSIEFNGS
jgi:type IV pilus assembly protein PilP